MIEKKIIKDVLDGKRYINDSDIKIDFENLTFAIIDDTNVNLPIIKKYFAHKGWKKMMTMCDEKRLQEWSCNCCKLDLNKTVENDTDEVKKIKKFKVSIGCDYCLEWYHLECVQLKNKPKGKLWMCPDCREKKNEN